MTIKQRGGIFGRNPTFNDVTIEGSFNVGTPNFTGNVTVTSGNLVIGTSGQGIDFSATAGTGTSELFSDYEEGTWTPIYETDGNPFTSITYTSTSATYTKIGNTVFISGFIRTNAITVGSASGQLKIGGLPFASSSNSAIAISQVGGFAGEMPRVASTTGTSMFLFFRTAADGSDSLLQASDAATGATANSVRFAGVYQA
jgi:hypothetical protein